jgi:hypothetical protein
VNNLNLSYQSVQEECLMGKHRKCACVFFDAIYPSLLKYQKNKKTLAIKKCNLYTQENAHTKPNLAVEITKHLWVFQMHIM